MWAAVKFGEGTGREEMKRASDAVRHLMAHEEWQVFQELIRRTKEYIGLTGLRSKEEGSREYYLGQLDLLDRIEADLHEIAGWGPSIREEEERERAKSEPFIFTGPGGGDLAG